ncbi:hypothetical protein [Massilia aerilata]|uniref:Uncharacterized protein n=1 Tax=Massilia aerilata TaxID=453817 RepID=A0ABW0S4M0_9BURK
MEHSFGLLREAFLQRLEDDRFGDFRIEDEPASIHEFIDQMTVGNVAMRHFGLSDKARFPDLTNLNITFAEFMRQPVQIEGLHLPVDTIFREQFCRQIASKMVMAVAHERPSTPAANAALAEVGAAGWRDWASAVAQPPHLARLAAEFAEIAVKTFAEKPLISFFIRSPVEGEFSMWGPWASTGQGRELPTRIVEGDGYSVSVRVFRYLEVECDVAAYEWEATLTMAGAAQPDAAACGMTYVFKREGGELVGGLQDLIIAADSMADSDVIQAKSFITQHDDAEDVIEKSDLCFVWLWDRRAGVAKGLGAKCLTAALDDLRRRFKKVRTVVFDARPGQFSNWTSRVDPPMVALEKQTAVENLVGYIQGLNLKFDVRTIFARSDNPDREAVIAYSQATDWRDQGTRQDEGDEPEQDENDIDLDKWEEEICRLFRAAGLEELAEEVENGDAAYDEVLAAIKHIVFESSVHYLRPSSSGDFEPSLIDMLDEVPHDDAHDQIAGMDEFCSGLPDRMHVSAVHWLDGYAICTVLAHTPFGDLTEYFTLVRKPRPINLESFFQSLGQS